MPFYKTYEPTREFINLFLTMSTNKPLDGDNREHPMLPIELPDGNAEDFLVRYYKRGGNSHVEDLMEYYPCIVIQDFQPQIDKTELWGRDSIEGAHDEESDTTERIFFPLPLMYKYQVSLVTDRRKHIEGASQWIYKNFTFNSVNYFTFNKIDTVEGPVGDVVRYSVQMQEVPREDGRFEYAMEFMMHSYVSVKNSEYTFENGSLVGGNFEDALTSVSIFLKRGEINTANEILSKQYSLGTIIEDALNSGGAGWSEFINTDLYYNSENDNNGIELGEGINIQLPLRDQGGIKSEQSDSLVNFIDNNGNFNSSKQLEDFLIRLDIKIKAPISNTRGIIEFYIPSIDASFGGVEFTTSDNALEIKRPFIAINFFTGWSLPDIAYMRIRMLDGDATLYGANAKITQLYAKTN